MHLNPVRRLSPLSFRRRSSESVPSQVAGVPAWAREPEGSQDHEDAEQDGVGRNTKSLSAPCVRGLAEGPMGHVAPSNCPWVCGTTASNQPFLNMPQGTRPGVRAVALHCGARIVSAWRR